jgi:hypothetical protein
MNFEELETNTKRNLFILRDERLHRKFSRKKHTTETLLNCLFGLKCKDFELDFRRGNHQIVYFKTNLDGLDEAQIKDIKTELEHNIEEIDKLFSNDEDYWYKKFINF